MNYRVLKFSLKLNHIMSLIGVGIPIQIFGGIMWSVGSSTAKFIFPELLIIGQITLLLGMSLFFIGVGLALITGPNNDKISMSKVDRK